MTGRKKFKVETYFKILNRLKSELENYVDVLYTITFFESKGF